ACAELARAAPARGARARARRERRGGPDSRAGGKAARRRSRRGRGTVAGALERARALGADACVRLGASDDLASALSEAAEGRIDVVVDPLFGEPFAAAVQAASFKARLVHLGTSAGAQATLPSAPIRGKMLVIMGHSNFGAPPDVRR